MFSHCLCELLISTAPSTWAENERFCPICEGSRARLFFNRRPAFALLHPTMVVENLLTSLRTDGDRITIIDQLLLPHQEKWIEIDSIEAAYDAIKTMKIRGAPAIASLAALSFASHLSIALKSDPQPAFLVSSTALKEHVTPQLNYLYSSRPTAVNLGAATKRLQNTLQAGLDADHAPADIAAALIKEGRLIADEDFGRNREMSKHGAEWLVQRIKSQGGEGLNLNVMTVCNTGSLATSVCFSTFLLMQSKYDAKTNIGVRNSSWADHTSV
ncbi:S-methyl-5-thioribose-1-phosphate isomerase [Ceratobasidium sp. 428]|nr:S-methyl-5-thioribose-1-phosphate isomerase [Ceratobasidium sp. 428]